MATHVPFTRTLVAESVVPPSNEQSVLDVIDAATKSGVQCASPKIATTPGL
jgi:hypothetical protein